MKTLRDYFNKFPEPIQSAIKEGMRVTGLGVVSYLLTEGAATFVVDAVFGVHVDPSTKLIIAGAITTGLKTVDKWLHEAGKENNNKSMAKGITRF